ncbi:MAG: hypothetical protein ACR2HG_01770 [Pyrinomonadaceae bacterium]
MTEIIGWVSSAILFLTFSRQIYKQWQEGTSEGVSIWLFVGQIAASTGFAVYSWLVGNWIFIFTNSLMVLNGLVGFFINMYLKKREIRNRKIKFCNFQIIFPPSANRNSSIV